MWRLTVRTRLTLWSALAMSLVLLVFALGVFGVVRESLLAPIDKRLQAHLSAVESTLRLGASEAELSELDRHGLLHVYSVREAGWPVYESGLWLAAELAQAQALGPSGATRVWRSPLRGLFHLRYATLELGGRRFEVAVGEEAEAVHRSLDRLAWTLGLALPVALLLAMGGSYVVAGRMLRPLGAMARQAHAISAERLSERLPVANSDDELGHLAGVLNDTFARLDDSFQRLQRFTQDAAHELRTPLAVMRGVGEAGMQDSRSADELREAIGSMLEEGDRLTRLVDGLLTLARADAGAVLGERSVFDVAILVSDVAECLRVLADEAQQSLSVCAPQPLLVHADRDALRLALMNLVGNALRYTPAAGAITLRAQQGPQGQALVEVRDTGPGIAAEHQARLFDRFYRVDRGRSRAAGGFGLGLAIARWAVQANGGHIELESLPGQGSCFRVYLPLADCAA